MEIIIGGILLVGIILGKLHNEWTTMRALGYMTDEQLESIKSGAKKTLLDRTADDSLRRTATRALVRVNREKRRRLKASVIQNIVAASSSVGAVASAVKQEPSLGLFGEDLEEKADEAISYSSNHQIDPMDGNFEPVFRTVEARVIDDQIVMGNDDLHPIYDDRVYN